MDSYHQNLRNYMEQLKSVTHNTSQSATSQRVATLTARIQVWHETRPIPERWQPVALGRVAALFGTTRELAAVALQNAGWKEQRKGGRSLWTAPI